MRSALRLVLAGSLAGLTIAAGSATLAAAAAPGPLDRVSAAPSELAAEPPLAVPGGGSIERYQQFAGGLPVIGAEAVVADPPAGPAMLVSDSTVAGIEPRGRARVGRAEALRLALAAAGVERRRAPGSAELGVDRRSGRTVWEVLVPAAEPLGDFSVLVDADDGSVLRIRDLLHRATGTAAIFVPNAIVANGGPAGLRDDKNRDSSLLTSLRAPVKLERITSPAGCLEGIYVNARVGSGRRAEPVCSPSLDFTPLTRAAPEFEAVMAYFHIDTTRAYVDSLGLTEPLRSQPQVVDTNAFAEDNSYFSPATRKVALGKGGVDDGEDADVIIHEYGHSLQDQATRFFGERLEGASMGEGFGDYLAAVMSSRYTGGSGFDPCMFEWDATSYTAGLCARRADKTIGKARALARCGDDPHCVGLAWSGAIWRLRGALGSDTTGQAVADRVVLESHFMLSRGSGFRDGARALIAADRLLYAGAHEAAIEAEMVARGFCKRAGC